MSETPTTQAVAVGATGTIVVPNDGSVYSRVVRRLEVDVDAKLQSVIEEAIEDGWDLVRYFGRSDWKESTAPDAVKRIVAAAVKRYIDNPDGLDQSVAGDERLSWKDTPEPGSIYLTTTEQNRLSRMATVYSSGFGTVQVYAYGTRSGGNTILGYDPRWVEPFPIFDESDPILEDVWP